MKQLYLLLILIVTCQQLHAQTTDDFFKNRCDFKTDGSGKANGLQVKFAIPCKWNEEKSKEKTLKTLEYEIDDENGIMMTISINTPKNKITPEKIDEVIANKDGDKKDAKRLWARKLKIDGVDCVEMANKVKKNVLLMNVYVYAVTYMFPYKDQMVTINYAIIGQDDKKALQRLNEYKTLFYKLANATDFLN